MSTTNKERVVPVDIQPNPYQVIIGTGSLATLGARLAETVKAKYVAVITDDNVGPLYADKALSSLKNAGFEPKLLTVPAGESSKSLEMVRCLYDDLAEARIDRTSSIVALGGGVVGDLAGFAAATWLRGVPYVQCPTTIVSVVDSSVGGKTGVNHTSGKNMIGSFYQPKLVLIDTATLKTLSERDFRAGLAESIKHGIIRDADFFAWHEENVESILGYDLEALNTLSEHNVRIKADIVAKDERELTGLRSLLNFGHTIGHAIESAMARKGDPWRHGECVAVGMVAACEMSVVAGKLDGQSADRVTTLLERAKLPTSAPLVSGRGELMDLMRSDKKVAAGKIRFVLLDTIGKAKLHEDIKPAWIEAGLDRVIK
ncbi:MAG: 3-dehydroquinate synthase [Planctomycetota bacterium]|jgi:3-dehydroquinate synthase